jgi:hypothetical protein
MLALGLAACNLFPGDSPPDVHQKDQLADTWPDSVPDAAPDTRIDGLADTGSDTVHDSRSDSSRDTEADIRADALGDAATDSLADTIPDTMADTLPDSLSDSLSELLSDSGTDSPRDTLVDATMDSLDGASPGADQEQEPDVLDAQPDPLDLGGPDAQPDAAVDPCTVDYCGAAPRNTARIVTPLGPVYVDLYEWPNQVAQLPLGSVNDPLVALQHCLSVGRRLCRLDELAAACGAPLPYPYGAEYLAEGCHTELPFSAAVSGAFPACARAPEGPFDLVGNLWEWSADGRLFGGSVKEGTDAACGLSAAPPDLDGFALAGFRCCQAPLDDLDGDGFPALEDCDDGAAAINPAAVEVCDTVDNDCNGLVDDALDKDKDTFNACRDCNDKLASIYPGAQDLPGDGVDANCDGLDGTDADGDGVLEGADCNDANPAINPAAPELCDGLDNDCDGQIDVNLAEGECDDQDPCTVGDFCQDKACLPGPASPSCDDGKTCTSDQCVPMEGCRSTPRTGACDDGNPCTDDDHCDAGLCVSKERDCNDKNPCTRDSCQSESGLCSHEAISGPCSDNSLCTVGDYCENKTCKPGADSPDCNDKNPCTTDSCSPSLGCQHVANTAPCDDQDPCTEGDICAGGFCIPGTRTCQCGSDADCGAFEDGVRCNGLLKCDKTSLPNRCVVDESTVITCSKTNDNACRANTCQEPGGTCALLPINQDGPCNDGNGCTTGDSCKDGTCVGATCASQGMVCFANQCLAPICEPGQAICDGSWAFKSCTNGGTAWNAPTACAASQYCQNGACANQVCQPGQPTCLEGYAGTCNDLGSGLQPGAADCNSSGAVCVLGVCVNETTCNSQSDCGAGQYCAFAATGSALCRDRRFLGAPFMNFLGRLANGRFLAGDGTRLFFPTISGEQITLDAIAPAFVGQNINNYSSLDYVHDGSTIIVNAYLTTDTLRHILVLDSNGVLQNEQASGQYLVDVSVSPDGRYLAWVDNPTFVGKPLATMVYDTVQKTTITVAKAWVALLANATVAPYPINGVKNYANFHFLTSTTSCVMQPGATLANAKGTVWISGNSSLISSELDRHYIFASNTKQLNAYALSASASPSAFCTAAGTYLAPSYMWTAILPFPESGNFRLVELKADQLLLLGASSCMVINLNGASSSAAHQVSYRRPLYAEWDAPDSYLSVGDGLATRISKATGRVLSQTSLESSVGSSQAFLRTTAGTYLSGNSLGFVEYNSSFSVTNTWTLTQTSLNLTADAENSRFFFTRCPTYSTCQVWQWTPDGGAQVLAYAGINIPTWLAEYSPARDSIFAVWNRTLRVFDLKTKTFAASFTQDDDVTVLEVDDASGLLLVGRQKGTLAAYDLSTLALKWEKSLCDRVSLIQANQSSGLAAVQCASRSYLIRLSDGGVSWWIHRLFDSALVNFDGNGALEWLDAAGSLVVRYEDAY